MNLYLPCSLCSLQQDPSCTPASSTASAGETSWLSLPGRPVFSGGDSCALDSCREETENLPPMSTLLPSRLPWPQGSRKDHHIFIGHKSWLGKHSAQQAITHWSRFLLCQTITLHFIRNINWTLARDWSLLLLSHSSFTKTFSSHHSGYLLEGEIYFKKNIRQYKTLRFNRKASIQNKQARNLATKCLDEGHKTKHVCMSSVSSWRENTSVVECANVNLYALGPGSVESKQQFLVLVSKDCSFVWETAGLQKSPTHYSRMVLLMGSLHTAWWNWQTFLQVSQ